MKVRRGDSSVGLCLVQGRGQGRPGQGERGGRNEEEEEEERKDRIPGVHPACPGQGFRAGILHGSLSHVHPHLPLLCQVGVNHSLLLLLLLLLTLN